MCRCGCMVPGLVLMLFLLFQRLGPVLSHATVRCDGKVRTLHVPSDNTGMLYSPNYPGLYPNSEECQWVLMTKESGRVMEVQVTRMDLETDEDGDTCDDYLAAYDGDSSKSPLLKKWCGQERSVVRSTGQSVMLHFVTNQLVRRSGFVLKYRSTLPYSSGCVEGGVRTLAVGDSPVLLQINHLNTSGQCTWTLQGEGNVRLVLDTVHCSGGLSCQDGNVSIADAGVEVDRWCGVSSAPFSSFYTSGREVSISTTLLSPPRPGKNVDLDLWIRVQSVAIDEECNMNSPSVLELVSDTNAPLYFPTPFSAWNSGEECTIRVQSPSSQGFRVDVLTTGDRAATCDDIDSPAVWISDGKRVEAECWRERYPVHWTHTTLFPHTTISVLPRLNTTSFLRVQTTKWPCTGYMIDKFYSGSRMITQTIRDIGYPRNAQCQLLIESSKGDHPVVQLQTNMLGEEGCGDVVTVYNGSSTEGEVLFNYCAGTDEELRGKRQVVSPGHSMLLVFSTDEDVPYGDGLEVKYFSVPETDICKGNRKDVYASSTAQILQSPGFPEFYPLNYDCYYHIKTNTTGDVIHVKLLSTKFERFSDFLQFFDDETLSTVMGGERLREFTSNKAGMTVRFFSDGEHSDGGWRLEYRSLPSGYRAAEQDMAFNQMTMIVAGSLGITVIVLAIISIILCCQRRDNPPPVHL